jgi:hypothetical protein
MGIFNNATCRLTNAGPVLGAGCSRTATTPVLPVEAPFSQQPGTVAETADPPARSAILAWCSSTCPRADSAQPVLVVGRLLIDRCHNEDNGLVEDEKKYTLFDSFACLNDE